MGVSSLWKALDRAGCGKPIGQDELRDPRLLANKRNTNPWNINERNRITSDFGGQTLAVDLSIWICESFTATAIANNHADPTLQLVYARIIRLLKLGIKLIVVVDGKRRTKGVHGELFTVQKRRSGTRFTSACQRCEQVLRLLGVPVVRAKAEGEALCALLNQRGIVDGVISNDGDCFLFGAKVLYTKFSLENLDKKRVMRYDADHIKACVDDVDDEQDNIYRNGGPQQQQNKVDIVNLSRNDLIAFAILTGSDLAGNGISQVGCRKAIRFVKKCQVDNPLKRETAAIDELRSWAIAASATESNIEQTKETRGKRHCSCCGHPGDKREHLKNGCPTCGTEPGEPCYQSSNEGKFRQSLRGKALLMLPKFNPEQVIYLYQHPNDHQIPVDFVGEDARSVKMKAPKLKELLESSFIVRGHYVAESRSYLKQSLGGLLARYELSSEIYERSENHVIAKTRPRNRNRPVPKAVTKQITRAGMSYFEIQWLVHATTTDSNGKSVDEFEFSTVEEQAVICKLYPNLVNSFYEEEKERRKQGTAEQEKRKAFLDSMCPKDDGEPNLKSKEKTRHKRRRGDFFFDTKSALQKIFPVQSNMKKHGSSKQFERAQKVAEGKQVVPQPSSNVTRDQSVTNRRTSYQRPLAAADRIREKKDDNDTIRSDTLVFAKHAHKASELGGFNIEPPGADEDDFDYSSIASLGSLTSMSPSGQPFNESLDEISALTPGHIHFLHKKEPSKENFENTRGCQNKSRVTKRISFDLPVPLNDKDDDSLESQRREVPSDSGSRMRSQTKTCCSSRVSFCFCDESPQKRRRRSRDHNLSATRTISFGGKQPIETTKVVSETRDHLFRSGDLFVEPCGYPYTGGGCPQKPLEPYCYGDETANHAVYGTNRATASSKISHDSSRARQNTHQALNDPSNYNPCVQYGMRRWSSNCRILSPKRHVSELPYGDVRESTECRSRVMDSKLDTSDRSVYLGCMGVDFFHSPNVNRWECSRMGGATNDESEYLGPMDSTFYSKSRSNGMVYRHEGVGINVECSNGNQYTATGAPDYLDLLDSEFFTTLGSNDRKHPEKDTGAGIGYMYRDDQRDDVSETPSLNREFDCDIREKTDTISSEGFMLGNDLHQPLNAIGHSLPSEQGKLYRDEHFTGFSTFQSSSDSGIDFDDRVEAAEVEYEAKARQVRLSFDLNHCDLI